MSDWPVWSLEEANAALPQIIVLTHQAASELLSLERNWAATPFRAYDALRRAPREDLIRADWARAVTALGAQPKGYFCVDFQSLDPEVVLCWIWGELRISHHHSHWDNCLERRAIVDLERLEPPSDTSHSDSSPNDSRAPENDWWGDERD